MTYMEVDGEEERTISSREKGKGKLITITDSLPWVEKYRPEKVDDLIAHQNILSTIQKFISQKQLPHLLFYGPPGTGKTSLILAIARQLYGQNFKSMILELNASDDRGIDVVREQIITFASTKKIFSSGSKLIILDEADAMTQPAQAALRRVMEKYTKNVRFCLICNFVSKIIPAIQSRCTKFRFTPLSRSSMETRLDYIIEQEKVEVTEDGKVSLLRLAKGDMRKALNILQSTYAAFQLVNEEHVYLCTGQPMPKDIEQVITWLLEKDFTTCYQFLNHLKLEKGLALLDLIPEIYQFVLLIEFPDAIKAFLIDQLAELENRLNAGSNEKIQMSCLISTFQLAKEMVAK